MGAVVWIYLGSSLGFWLAGWFLSARFRRVPRVAGRSAAEARISVVIPARNEEHNLARLLPSLLQNGSPPHEVIVVNDQSEDATGAVAKGNGAKVLNGKSLPEGWYGKPWACQQGADAATGDWLLFLDADTVMESGGLARIHGLTRYDQAVHSICPHHRVEKPYEQLSAFFNVVMILGMNAFTLMGFQAKSIGLFGQALLISRPQYDSVEGHRPVKREVLENFHLSRHLARVGYQCRCYLGKGTLWMRMFPGGYQDLVAGWSKGFVSGADNTPKSALIGISFWLSGLIMGTMALNFLLIASELGKIAIAIFYLLCALQCLFLFRNAGTFRWYHALFFPVGLFFYQSVFFQALYRKKRGGTVEWKGRHVD